MPRPAILRRSMPRKIVSTLRNSVRRYRFGRRVKKSPLKLVIGASGIYDAGWIPSDIQYLNLLNPHHWTAFFREGSVDAMLAEHVWEHLTVEEGRAAADICFKYLKPEGYLRVAVPDGYHADERYIEHVKPGGTGAGADDHKVLYNYTSFSDVFEQAGFEVHLLEYFDKDRRFHYSDWDPEHGTIIRSRRLDERNRDGKLNYTSLILDAYKPK